MASRRSHLTIPQRLKRRTGVTVKQLNAECDDQRLHELSEYIVDYRKYGPWLGLSDADIEDIEGNPYILSSKKLKAAEVFKKWHRMKSCEATYLQLLEVALKLNDGSGAEKICQICAKGGTVDSGHPSVSSAPSHNLNQLVSQKSESCEHIYILPALFSTILVTAIYLYMNNEYWRKAHEDTLYKIIGFIVGIAVCLTLLYICHILYKAYSKKNYTPVLVFSIVFFGLILCLIWKLHTIASKTSNNDSEEAPRLGEPLDKSVGNQPLNLEKPLEQETIEQEKRPVGTQADLKQETKETVKEEQLPMPERTPPLEETPSKHTSSSYCQKTDCETCSKQLLSETTLTPKKKHPDRLAGQVIMFDKDIGLTGRPEAGKVYTASALYFIDRQLNTEGNSYTSVEDAIEKALIKMCKNLRRKFGL